MLGILKGGTGARASQKWRCRVLSGREDGRQAETKGGHTETEKIFSGGRGCVSLWRGILGRCGELDGGRIKW